MSDYKKFGIRENCEYLDDTEDTVATPKKDIATTVLLIIGYIIAGVVIGYLTYYFIDIMLNTNSGDNSYGWNVLGYLIISIYGLAINLIPTILGTIASSLCKKRNLPKFKHVLSNILSAAPILIPIIYFAILYIPSMG